MYRLVTATLCGVRKLEQVRFLTVGERNVRDLDGLTDYDGAHHSCSGRRVRPCSPCQADCVTLAVCFEGRLHRDYHVTRSLGFRTRSLGFRLT